MTPARRSNQFRRIAAHLPFRGMCGAVPLAVQLAAGAAQAEDQRPWDSWTWLDSFRAHVQGSALTLAQQIDDFLNDREYQSELQKSQLTLRFIFDHSTDDGTEFRIQPRLRYRWPYSERSIFLDVLGTRNSELGSDGGTAAGPPSDLLGGEERRAVQIRTRGGGVGVRFFPGIGIGQEDGDYTLFAGVRASAKHELAPGYSVYGSQRLYYHSNRGWEAISLTRGDWQASERMMVRAQLRVDWREDKDGFAYYPALLFRRLMSDNAVLSFENYIEASTRPSHALNAYYTGFRYRRKLNRDWLFGEITPWIGFEDVSDYDTIYGLQMRVDVKF